MSDYKSIEQMAMIMGGCHTNGCKQCREQAGCPHCSIFEQAKVLADNNFGNIPEALVKLTEKLKINLTPYMGIGDYYVIFGTIDETLKEMTDGYKM